MWLVKQDDPVGVRKLTDVIISLLLCNLYKESMECDTYMESLESLNNIKLQ